MNTIDFFEEGFSSNEEKASRIAFDWLVFWFRQNSCFYFADVAYGDNCKNT
jgi:hypothetical protein